MESIAFAVAAAFISAVPSALAADAAESKSPGWEVGEVSITRLVDDPLVTESSIRQELGQLLREARFITGEPARGITGGFYQYDSPFRHGHARDTLAFVLDLERADYEFGKNPESQLLATTFFGIWGLVATSGDSRLGIAQIRLATKGQTSIEVVGSGFALAPTATGSRRILLPLAVRRALYDALTKLTIRLHEYAGTASSRQQVTLSGNEFRTIVDGPHWSEIGRKLANPRR